MNLNEFEDALLLVGGVTESKEVLPNGDTISKIIPPNKHLLINITRYGDDAGGGVSISVFKGNCYRTVFHLHLESENVLEDYSWIFNAL